MKEIESFKDLGEMRRRMGSPKTNIFTDSDDRIPHRQLKYGGGGHSGIDEILFHPILGELIESMTSSFPDDANVSIKQMDLGGDNPDWSKTCQQ